MELKNIREDVARVDVEYMGETIVVKYRPGMVTPRTWGLLSEAESTEQIAEFYSQLISWWDVTDKGKNVAVDVDSVSNMPMPFIAAVSQAILKDVPERDAGKDFVGGSPSVTRRRSVPKK